MSKIKSVSILWKLAILAISLLALNTSWAFSLNTWLKKAMKAYHTPVVSYAIINHGRIVKTQSVSIDPELQVNTHSVFQAASISKSLTAYGALKLVANKQLSLNKPANHYLTSWRIPRDRSNPEQPVLIHHLMDMTSGLSVSGFAGYPKGHDLPTSLDILNGKPPANNAPIRVKYQPGTRYFYSGGGYQVLQQIITDVTDQDFTAFVNQQVLQPLDMKHSLFQYPLTDHSLLAHAVPGFTGYSEHKIPGGWRQYKCAGACGMWSTPTDLARFLLNVTHSLHGKQDGFLPQSLTKKMLTRQANTDFGLGVVVGGQGQNLYFWKAGHNKGYHSLMLMLPNRGKGITIMTNSETGDKVIRYFVALISQHYSWPCSIVPFFDELVEIPSFAQSVAKS